MSLFGHHAQSIIDIEVFGHDIMPDTATEHVIFLAVVVLLLGLMLYGAYAAVRDVIRWRRRAT